jgi:hypothetical protein
MGLEQNVGVVETLGEAEQLLPQGPPRLINSPQRMHMTESPQYTEELLRLTDPLT